MIVHVASVWCALVAQALSLTIPSDELEKRLQYMEVPIVQFVEGREALKENFRRMHPELRQKRFEGLADYVALEDPNAKRSSLKRLAILSARGFGRK
ncbi:hypothetical protein V3C99_015466 [Haemonchus contortus]|uniref:DUF1330 domain-containing protein n=1 Tax=Haemonchus contortus TaxID=6289 RepID=A0A7I4YV98_HAECO|nr:unnamed protein product [Haemonchus contortus]CDJ95979.1 unnamed protein product [Haemonchus contortus]